MVGTASPPRSFHTTHLDLEVPQRQERRGQVSLWVGLQPDRTLVGLKSDPHRITAHGGMIAAFR